MLPLAVYGTGGTGEEGDASPQDESSANFKWNTWDRNNKTLEGSYLGDFRQAATDAGITIYQSSEDKDGGWGYYCYYYYWNRHNDNGVEGGANVTVYNSSSKETASGTFMLKLSE